MISELTVNRLNKKKFYLLQKIIQQHFIEHLIGIHRVFQLIVIK